MPVFHRPASSIYGETHELFRDSIRRFTAELISPNLAAWEAAGLTPRSTWQLYGNAGILCPQVDHDYGGTGLDFSYNAIIAEEMGYISAPPSLLVHSDIVAQYLIAYGTEEQKHRWLPDMVAGSVVGAIAMTEPGAGSDLQGIHTRAARDGENYLINGVKSYITNGAHADIVIVVARTDLEAGSRGLSLFIVEADSPGFTKGQPLSKIGQSSGDTNELFFVDVAVPCKNLLGSPGAGFECLMTQLPQERLSIAISAQATAQRAFDEAICFVKDRKAFGQPIFAFQNTRFTLADLAADLQVGWAHIDWAIQLHLGDTLTAAQASACKLWHTELQWRCCDTALQLHGGAGYMNEYPIARIWKDSRVTRIFGGTSEIMREVVSRSL